MDSPSATTPAKPIATPNKKAPMAGGMVFPRGAFGAGSPESDIEEELLVRPKQESPVEANSELAQQETIGGGNFDEVPGDIKRDGQIGSEKIKETSTEMTHGETNDESQLQEGLSQSAGPTYDVHAAPFVQPIPPFRGPVASDPEPTVNIAMSEYNRLYHRDFRFRQLETSLLRGKPFIRENWCEVRANDPDFVPIQEIIQPKAQNRARTGTFPQGSSHSPIIFDGASKKKFNGVVSPALNKAVLAVTKAVDSGKHQPSVQHQKQSVQNHKQPNVGAQQGQNPPGTPSPNKSSKKKKAKVSPQNNDAKGATSQLVAIPEGAQFAGQQTPRKGNGPKNSAQSTPRNREAELMNRHAEHQGFQQYPHTSPQQGFYNDARRYYQTPPFGQGQGGSHYDFNRHQYEPHFGTYYHQGYPQHYYGGYQQQGYDGSPPRENTVPEHYTESQLLAHQADAYREVQPEPMDMIHRAESVVSTSDTRQAAIISSPKSTFSGLEGIKFSHGLSFTANDHEEDDDEAHVGWYMPNPAITSEKVNMVSKEDKSVQTMVTSSPKIEPAPVKNSEPTKEEPKEVVPDSAEICVKEDLIMNHVVVTPLEAVVEDAVTDEAAKESIEDAIIDEAAKESIEESVAETTAAPAAEVIASDEPEKDAVTETVTSDELEKDAVAEPTADIMAKVSAEVEDNKDNHEKHEPASADLELAADGDTQIEVAEPVQNNQLVSIKDKNIPDTAEGKSVSVEDIPGLAEMKSVKSVNADALSDSDSDYDMIVSYSTEEKGDIFKPSYKKLAVERPKEDKLEDIAQDYAELKKAFDAPKSQNATVNGWSSWKPAGGVKTPSPALEKMLGNAKVTEKPVELTTEDFPQLGADLKEKEEVILRAESKEAVSKVDSKETGEKAEKKDQSRSATPQPEQLHEKTPSVQTSGKGKETVNTPASSKKKKPKTKKKGAKKSADEKAATTLVSAEVKDEKPKVEPLAPATSTNFPPLPPLPKKEDEWHVATSKKSRHAILAPTPTMSMLEQAANTQLPRSAASSVAGDANPPNIPPSNPAGLWAKIAATNKPSDVIEVKPVTRAPDVKSLVSEPRTTPKVPTAKLPVRYGYSRKLYIASIPKTMTYEKFMVQIKGGLIDDIYISGLSPDFKKGDPVDPEKEDWFGYITFYDPEGAQHFIRHLESIYPQGKNKKRGKCPMGQICGYIVLDDVTLPVYMRDHDQRPLQPDVRDLVEKHNATRVLTMTFKNRIGLTMPTKFKVDRENRDEVYTPKWTWDRWYKALGTNEGKEAIQKIVDSMQVWEGKPKCYYEKIEHKQLPTSEKTVLSIVPKTRLGPDPAGTWRIKIYFLRIGTAEQVIRRLASTRDFREHCVFGYADDPCAEISVYEEPKPDVKPVEVEVPEDKEAEAEVLKVGDVVDDSTVNNSAEKGDIEPQDTPVVVADSKPKDVKEIQAANTKPPPSPAKKKKARKPQQLPPPPPPPAPRMTSDKQFPTLGGTLGKQVSKPKAGAPAPGLWARMAAKPPAPEVVAQQDLKENARPSPKSKQVSKESPKKGSTQQRGPRPAIPRGNTNTRPPRQDRPDPASRAQTPTPQAIQECLLRSPTPRPKVQIPNENGTVAPHNTPVTPINVQKAFPLAKTEDASQSFKKPQQKSPIPKSQSPKLRSSSSGSRSPARKTPSPMPGDEVSTTPAKAAPPPKKTSPKPIQRGRSPAPLAPLPSSFIKPGANWADDSESEDEMPAPAPKPRLQQLKPLNKIVKEAAAAQPEIQEPKPVNIASRAQQPATSKVVTPPGPNNTQPEVKRPVSFEKDFPALGQAKKDDSPSKPAAWRPAWKMDLDGKKGG